MEEQREPDYEWWPDGCTIAAVRECNCEECQAFIEALEHMDAAERGEEPVTEDGDASLAAFTEAKA